jgi:HSP20 family molecular chaperone IbpA
MKFILIISLLFVSTICQAQTREEILEEFRKERQEMMSEILEIFQSDSMGEAFFDDDMNPFDNIKKLRDRSNVTVEEKHEDNGSISVLITPKSDQIELDIQTKHNMITIKSETKIEEESLSGGSSFKNVSSSSYSQSISIPQGYIAESPVTDGRGLKIVLRPAGLKKLNAPVKVEASIKNQESGMKLVPIGKIPGEEVI